MVSLNPAQNGDNDTVALQTRQPKFSIFSATQGAMLHALDQVHRIATIDRASFYAETTIQQAVAAKSITPVGNPTQINPEYFVGKSPLILAISGFDQKPAWSDKVTPLGHSVLRVWEWKEAHPLARAEWLLAFGYLSGTFQKAQRIFQQEVSRYQKLAQNLPEQHPTVFSGNPYQGVWYCPGGTSFMATLMADGGLQYVYRNISQFGSHSTTAEKASMRLAQSSKWLYHGSCTTRACLKELEPRLEPLLSNITVYAPNRQLQKNGANPFWGEASVFPSLILEDYHAIAQQENPKNYYEVLE